MAQDPHGRPAKELDKGQGQYITPYSSFGTLSRLGGADHTDVIQRAWDWSAATGLPVGQEGDFYVNTVQIKNRVKIIGGGYKTTNLISRTGADEPSTVTLAQDVVQDVRFEGMTIQGSGAAGVHAMHLRAKAAMASGYLQGGLWYFTFKDLLVQGFEGECIWLDGGGNAPGDPEAFRAPIQFGTFERVIVLAGHTKRALRLSGQVGQVGFDEASEFDGPLAGGFFTPWVAENILIERARTITDTLDSDSAPYALLFRGTTCQGNKRLITIERAATISLLGMHFENSEEGILNSISAFGNVIDHCYFGRVGYRADGTGWGIKNNGGEVTTRDLSWAELPGEPTGYHYVSEFDQAIVFGGYHVASNGIRTMGLTNTPLTPAAVVSVYDGRQEKYIPLIGPSDVAVTNIASPSVVADAHVRFRAVIGHVTLDNGTLISSVAVPGASYTVPGIPISIAPYVSPLRIPANGEVDLYYSDNYDGTPGVWRVKAVSGQRGHIHPVPQFVGSATLAAPYTPSAESGTLKVSAAAADAYIKLPDWALVPSGTRITIKKIDGTTNKVYINGWNSGQTVEGFTPNFIYLSRQLQSVTIEQSVLGGGSWEIVAFHPGVGGPSTSGAPWQPADGVASGLLSTNAPLTFGTHLTPATGTFDGSAAVTLATDATSVATASTIVARNGIGAAQFFRVTNTGPNSLFGTPAGSAGDKASQNILLYDFGPTSWAGIQANGAGDMVLSVGTATRFSMSLLAATGELYTPSGILPGPIAAFRAGSIGTYGPYGLVIQAVTGSSFDFMLVNPSGGSAIFYVLTGTLTVNYNGSINAVGVNAASFSIGTVSRITDVSGYTQITGQAAFSTTGASGGRILVGPVAEPGIYLDTNAVHFRSMAGGEYLTSAATSFSTLGVFTIVSSLITSSVVLRITTAIGGTAVDILDTAGSSGMSVTPANSSSGAYFDNRRVGSSTFYRCSNVSGSDTVWLTVTGAGATTFSGFMTLTNNILGRRAVFETTTGAGSNFIVRDTVGVVQFAMQSGGPTQGAFIDNTRIGGSTFFRSSNVGTSDVVWLSVTPAGVPTFSQGLATGAPAGGTAATWKHGSIVNTSVSANFSRYVELDINGVLVGLLTKT